VAEEPQKTVPMADDYAEDCRPATEAFAESGANAAFFCVLDVSNSWTDLGLRFFPAFSPFFHLLYRFSKLIPTIGKNSVVAASTHC